MSKCFRETCYVVTRRKEKEKEEKEEKEKLQLPMGTRAENTQRSGRWRARRETVPRRFESIDSVEWIVQPAIARYMYIYIYILTWLVTILSFPGSFEMRGESARGEETRPLEEALALINNRRFVGGAALRAYF